MPGPGNRAKRGEPGRPAHVGYQKGHPPYYTGGSVPGHAPTNRAGNTASLPTITRRNDPTSPHYPFLFGQPAGEENRKKGHGRPKDKECRCLQEMQAGQDRDEILQRRYPVRMIARMRALLKVSEDPSHRDWMNALREVSKILERNRGTAEAAAAAEAKKPEPTSLIFGHLDVPMPGSSQDEEGSPGGVVPEEPREPAAREG